MNHTPYSPYIKDRQTLDDSFSKGWVSRHPPRQENTMQDLKNSPLLPQQRAVFSPGHTNRLSAWQDQQSSVGIFTDSVFYANIILVKTIQ